MVAEDVYAHVGGRMELKAADTMRLARGSPTQTWANAGTERREGGADGEWRKEGTRAHEHTAKPTISSAAQPNANRSTTTRSSMCEMIHAWVGEGTGEQDVATKYTARAPHQ